MSTINKITGYIVEAKELTGAKENIVENMVALSMDDFRKLLVTGITEVEYRHLKTKKLHVRDFAPKDVAVFERKYALLEMPKYDIDAKAYIAKAVNLRDEVTCKNGKFFCPLYFEVWLPDDPISQPSETWLDGEIEIKPTMWWYGWLWQARKDAGNE